jgi:hypothetical protein
MLEQFYLVLQAANGHIIMALLWKRNPGAAGLLN